MSRYDELTDAEKLERLERWMAVYDIPLDHDPGNQAHVELQNLWQLSWALSGEQIERLLEARCPYAKYIQPGERIIVNCRCRDCQKHQRGAWDPRR